MEHPYIGVAHGNARKRRLRLATGFYVIYEVQPRNRAIRIANVFHESELYR